MLEIEKVSAISMKCVRPWKANGRSSAQAAAAAIGTPYGLFVPDIP
jgi:hypothetical protein